MGRKGRLRKLKNLQQIGVVRFEDVDLESSRESFYNLTEADFYKDGRLKPGVYFLPSSVIPLIKYHQ